MEESKTKDDIKRKQFERQREAKIVRRIVFVITMIIILTLTGVITGGYLYIKSALEPFNEEDTAIKKVTIPIGSSVRGIANILEENEIIKDAKVFRYYVKFKNEESGFQAGDYQLSASMEIPDIIAQLKTGKVIKEAKFSITVPEGKHLEQIATIVSKKTDYTLDEIMEKLNDQEYIKELIKLYPTILSEDILNEKIRYPLEGYLFPATYQFYDEQPTIEEIIQTMLSKTETILSAYLSKIQEKEVTMHEFMTMASLVEEEATQKADREKIAGVFYNRLEKGMPLQTDPTVLYALGQHQVQITYDDLKVDSPYNTYVVSGLPIGPIASPGEMSMVAALNPAETNDYYFYARPNGEVIFTSTLSEHNQVKNKYKHEWDEYKK